MKVVLDSNVLIHWVRDDDTWRYLDGTYQLSESINDLIISAVTAGEVISLGKRKSWGREKMEVLDEMLSRLTIIEVDYSNILDIYAELEDFSSSPRRKSGRKGAAIAVGKNDLWIAAATVIAEVPLLTSDDDFDHFAGVYFEVIKYQRQPKT